MLREIKADLKEVHAISMDWKMLGENIYSAQSDTDWLPSWSKPQQDPPATPAAYNAGDPGSIPGSGRSCGEENVNPLQYSCLEKSHGQRSLVGYSPWGHKESDTTEWLHLEVVNSIGQRLIEFCQEDALVTANTLIQQHKRRLYTWTSPDGQHWNQIDYILCSQR